jgi:hypothetical protein
MTATVSEPVLVDIQVCYASTGHFIEDHRANSNDEDLASLAEAVRTLYATPTGKTYDALGVYFLIKPGNGPKEIRYYRFMTDEAVREDVENDLYIRNTFFQGR